MRVVHLPTCNAAQRAPPVTHRARVKARRCDVTREGGGSRSGRGRDDASSNFPRSDSILTMSVVHRQAPARGGGDDDAPSRPCKMCDAVLSSLAELRAHQRVRQRLPAVRRLPCADYRHSLYIAARSRTTARSATSASSGAGRCPGTCAFTAGRARTPAGSATRASHVSGGAPRVANDSSLTVALCVCPESGTLQRHMRTHTGRDQIVQVPATVTLTVPAGERPHERGLCKRDLATNMVVGCSNGFVGMVPAATSPVASAVSLPVANTGAGGVPLRPRQAAPAASYPVFTVRNVVRRRPGAACRSLRTGGIAAGRDRLPTTLLPDGKLDDAKSIAAARLLESIAIEFARRSQATTEHATVTKVSTTTTFQAVHDRGLSRAALDSRMFHQRRDVGLHASAFVTAKLC